MRLLELNTLQPFKTDEYNTPNQMEIMANPDYWREKKGVVGGVQWMSPTEYIRACELGFRRNGTTGLIRQGRNAELIKQYANDMKRGDKFPMLELDYRNDYFGQEGLHRAMAAESIGVKKVPVFIMKDSPEKMSEAAIKIGGEKNPKIEEFMDKYYKVTQVHPFDPAARIAWDGKSTVTIVPFKDHIHLSAIQTLAPEERSGSANGVVMTLVALADETGVPLRLNAKPFGEMKGKLTKRQLKAGYKRRGFTPAHGDAMEYNPPIKESITEGISPIVYHAVGSSRDALSILTQNKFKLTASSGTDTERALQKGGRQYSLSTTRHKFGGFHLGTSDLGIMFNLDGTKLAQNYAGKAVDYWGADWYGPPGSQKKGYQEKEAEDRIYSHKPFIPNASKYIKEIHMYLTPEGEERYKGNLVNLVHLRRMLIAAKRRGIPTFTYTSKTDWLQQNKRKAVNPSKIKSIIAAKGKEYDQQRRYYSDTKYYLGRWIELYTAPVGAKLSDEAQRIKREVLYGYGDLHLTLSSEIHNAKSKPADETGMETLLKIFRKEKITSSQQYIDLLKAKWKPKDES